MKKVISVLLALVLALSLFACAKRDNNETTTAADGSETTAAGETLKADENGLKEITLCLDWTPNTNHTGFYVADAKGYYKDAGLKIRIVQPPEDGAELMCAAGQAQFAISFQDTIAASFASDSPIGVTAVAAILQHNTSGIITRKGEGADRPKGLEGMTYSTWDSPIEKAMIKYVMEKDGGDFSKLTLIPSTVTDEASALKNKDTDAIWIFYGWAGINAELQGLDFDYFDFISIDNVFDYYTPMIIANNDFLKNDPETAKAFLAATKKGYEFAIENPEESAQILIDGDTTGSLKGSEELVTASQKWISKQYKADADEWGVFDANRWDNFYKWLSDNNLVEKRLEKGTGFTNDFIQ